MKKLTKLFWGLSIAAIGVALILNVIGVLDFDIFFKGWWTLLMIIPCVAHFISQPNWGSVCCISIAVILLLQAQGYIDWDIFWKLCPLVLFTTLGLAIVFSKDGRPDLWNRPGAKGECITVPRDGKNVLKITTAFGEQNRRIDSKAFEGADIEVSFGSVRLDLRDAIINEDVQINVKASFAGVGIYVPKDVNVEVRSHCTFGGVDNKTDERSGLLPPSHTVILVAECSFAGVEVM